MISKNILPKFQITPQVLWCLYFFAAATFVFSLFYPYVGEESAYTITSIEMWKSHNFLIPTLLGWNYGRPPFYNWLIIPLANLFGWSHMLVAARVVTLVATTATGVVLAWLAKVLSKNDLFAALCVILFFSFDTLFYRGWLAYADPLFGFFVFSAIASLWVGVHNKKTWLLWLAVICVTAGGLTKVQTAYVFYVVALVVLVFNGEYRKIILSLSSIAAHFFGVLLFVAWYFLVTKGVQQTTGGEIIHKLLTLNIWQYGKQLWSYPIELFTAFLPGSALICYLWIRRRLVFPATNNHWLYFAIVIALVNFLPYWLVPHTELRYLVPIYPLIALIMAKFIFQAGEKSILLMSKWFVVLVVIKFLVATIWFPYYQNHFRGHYAEIAQDILAKTHGAPLYTTDVSATGLSVTAHIDTLLYPNLLTTPPDDFRFGYVMSYTNDAKYGSLVEQYKLGGNSLFLFYHPR